MPRTFMHIRTKSAEEKEIERMKRQVAESLLDAMNANEIKSLLSYANVGWLRLHKQMLAAILEMPAGQRSRAPSLRIDPLYEAEKIIRGAPKWVSDESRESLRHIANGRKDYIRMQEIPFDPFDPNNFQTEKEMKE